MRSSVTKANLILVLVTLMWGMTFPLIKEALVFVSPSTFVFFRFLVAGICFLPFLFKKLRDTNQTLIIAGAILAVLNGGIYLFQTIGLETISGTRSAFITGANVLIVPFLLPFFRLGRPTRLDVVTTVIAFVGLFILTGASLSEFKPGDYWTLSCAFLYALAIVFVQWVTPRITSYSLLSFYQIVIAIPLLMLIATPDNYTHILHTRVIVAILFCAIAATVLAFNWQMKYQQKTTAVQAALIYCLEPVFASFFVWLINGQAVTAHVWFGGGLMLLAIVLPILYRLKWREDKVQSQFG